MPTFEEQLLTYSVDQLKEQGRTSAQIIALVTLHLKMPLWPAQVEDINDAVRELNGGEPIYVPTSDELEAVAS